MPRVRATRLTDQTDARQPSSTESRSQPAKAGRVSTWFTQRKLDLVLRANRKLANAYPQPAFKSSLEQGLHQVHGRRAPAISVDTLVKQLTDTYKGTNEAKQIYELYIGGDTGLSPRAIGAIVSLLPNLNHINLSYRTFSHGDFKFLVDEVLTEIPYLRELDMAFADLDWKKVRTLAQQPALARRLRVLNLECNHDIKDEGLYKLLGPSSFLTKLTNLNIESCFPRSQTADAMAGICLGRGTKALRERKNFFEELLCDDMLAHAWHGGYKVRPPPGLLR